MNTYSENKVYKTINHHLNKLILSEQIGESLIYLKTLAAKNPNPLPQFMEYINTNLEKSFLVPLTNGIIINKQNFINNDTKSILKMFPSTSFEKTIKVGVLNTNLASLLNTTDFKDVIFAKKLDTLYMSSYLNNYLAKTSTKLKTKTKYIESALFFANESKSFINKKLDFLDNISINKDLKNNTINMLNKAKQFTISSISSISKFIEKMEENKQNYNRVPSHPKTGIVL